MIWFAHANFGQIIESLNIQSLPMLMTFFYRCGISQLTAWCDIATDFAVYTCTILQYLHNVHVHLCGLGRYLCRIMSVDWQISIHVCGRTLKLRTPTDELKVILNFLDGLNSRRRRHNVRLDFGEGMTGRVVKLSTSDLWWHEFKSSLWLLSSFISMISLLGSCLAQFKQPLYGQKKVAVSFQ